MLRITDVSPMHDSIIVCFRVVDTTGFVAYVTLDRSLLADPKFDLYECLEAYHKQTKAHTLAAHQ